jgi:hypothetical protein
MIYETDTDLVLVWNGSAWYPPKNTSWGIVDTTSGGTSGRGYRLINVGQTINQGATTLITDSSMTFTAITGRLYRASINGYVASTSGSGLATLYCRDGANVIQAQWGINITNSQGISTISAYHLFTATGAVNRNWALLSTTGNNNFGGATTPLYVTIEDIGAA